MPMNKALYPKNWDEISRAIKDEAVWNCEQCGRPCRRPGEDDDDLYDRLLSTGWVKDLFDEVETPDMGVVPVPKFGRFTLTTAHLNHIPEDCRRENLKALCSVCHCRYDLAALPTKRRLKAERLGQLTLPIGGEADE